MTDRIRKLYEYQWEKQHHAHRASVPEGIENTYRRAELTDRERSALRTVTALNLETPVIAEGELIAFTRTVPNLPLIFTDDEWAEIRRTHYIHELGYVSNLSPDYEKVIRRGLIDLMPEGEGRAPAEALLRLVKRYETEARSLGDEALADTLARVPAYGARTLREALQSLRILHFAMWVEGDYHNTLGLFDRYIEPYFENDLANGTETEESAFELIEAFFLSCNRDSDLYPGMQQGDNGQSIVLGSKGFTKLSSLCLKASADLKLIDPKINLRVTKDTPLSVYEEGTRLTKLGLGFPQYENDDVAVPALEALGYAKKDAENYAMAACWEFIIPGKGMEIPNIGALPFANLTDEAIRESLPACRTPEDLLSVIEKKIYASVRETVKACSDLYVIPSPYLSIFFDTDKDISLGCVYNNWGLHGTGLAPAADMLAAVEYAVFGGKVTADELLRAMSRNFEDDSELLHLLKTECPKMGNDDDRADRYAVKLLDIFAESVKGLKNERGGIIRAGTGSAMYYISHAAPLGATADGREAGVPLPANYSPSLNIKLNGPVSLIKSFTKPDLGRTVNGGPLTVEFSESVFTQDDSVTKAAQLIKYFISRGGHQIQLNTVNCGRLLDAQKHPENYRNLIVRVWGWSGYFVELDKCYQDHIIQRAELTL